MKIRCLLSFTCFISLVTSFAQPQKNKETVVVPVTKILFFSPGVSYELPIGKKQTLVAGAFLPPIFSFAGGADGSIISHFKINPATEIGYRYYYNGTVRQRKGKGIEMNSMNYLSSKFGLSYTKAAIQNNRPNEDERRAVYSLGAVWGMQRNYNKRFSLDLQLGIGYGFGLATQNNGVSVSTRSTVGQLGVITNLTLGFWLNRRKE